MVRRMKKILILFLLMGAVFGSSSAFAITEAEAWAECSAKKSSMGEVGSSYVCKPSIYGHDYIGLYNSSNNSLYASWNYVNTIQCEKPLVEKGGECACQKEGSVIGLDENNFLQCETPMCWTDFATGEQVCNNVVDDDPYNPDDQPQNCVTTADGFEACIADDAGPGCYTVNGLLMCPDDPDNNKICGEKNGTIQCVVNNDDPGGCGNFNGEYVCVADSGDVIPPNSPDHPQNGGNADGNENNDPTDPRTPEEGGNPDRQPGTPLADLPNGVASEFTLGKINSQLSGIGKTLKDIAGKVGTGSGGSDGSGEEPTEETPLTFTGEGVDWSLLNDGQAEYQQVMDDYKATIASIRAEVSGVLGSLSGSGGLYSNSITVHGVDVDAGLDKWQQNLSVVPSIILFAAAFIALGILMGGSKD